MPSLQERAYRASLPVHPDQHRTGAVDFDPSPSDYQALWLPGIAAHAAAGPPAEAMSLLSLVKEPRLDQGGTGACVAGSTEGNCQMARSAADGTWPGYSIPILYGEAGGSGSNGVDVRTVMGLCIDKGTPLVAGGRDKVIKSYLFVDQAPGNFRTQVKAAIAAGHPVLIASLLPIPFGWKTGMPLSQGYHQYLGLAYQTDASGTEWLIILNDWNDSWPGDAPAGIPRGCGRISFDALEQAGQNGYRYGVLATTLTVTPPVPDPPPPPPPVITGATIGGHASGAGVANLKPNQVLALPGGLDIALSSVVFDSTPPPPPPGQITITSYSPSVVNPGDRFTIQGSGFSAGGNLFVTWGDTPLDAARAGDTAISATAPVGVNAANAVTVRIEGATATGPLLQIGDGGPPPPPPPVGDIDVKLTLKPQAFRNLISVVVYTAKGGQSFPAHVSGTVSGSLGTVALDPEVTRGTLGPAIWTLPKPGAVGELVTVEVDASSGESSGTATKQG